MRLMDDIMRQALANMEARKGPCLEMQDFAFGFGMFPVLLYGMPHVSMSV
jgi:hypothetical protein